MNTLCYKVNKPQEESGALVILNTFRLLVVKYNALKLSFFFFSAFSFPLQRLWTDFQKLFACLSSVVAVNTFDQYRGSFVDIEADNNVYVLEFRVCEHDMSCALEKNSNGRIKQALETCFSTTKNISPMLQCLWPTNLAGWWYTMRWGAPTHKVTWPFNNKDFGSHVKN